MPHYNIVRVDQFNFRKAFSANSTLDAYVAKVPTTTKPSAGISTQIVGGGVPQKVLVQPYGSDAQNEAFTLRIYGWRQVDLSGTPLWVPSNLAEFTCTIGNVAATSLGTSNLLCDTVAKVGTIAHAEVQSPGNDTPGFATVTLQGFDLIEFATAVTSAASANALYAFI